MSSEPGMNQVVWTDPESAAFFEKHMALTENGGTNEIWNVL